MYWTVSALNTGVSTSTGKIWSDNRRFLLRHLRDLGMGKTHLEHSIMVEAKMLVDHLEMTSVDKPAEVDWSINVAVLNVIWQMLAGVWKILTYVAIVRRMTRHT